STRLLVSSSSCPTTRSLLPPEPTRPRTLAPLDTARTSSLCRPELDSRDTSTVNSREDSSWYGISDRSEDNNTLSMDSTPRSSCSSSSTSSSMLQPRDTSRSRPRDSTLSSTPLSSTVPATAPSTSPPLRSRPSSLASPPSTTTSVVSTTTVLVPGTTTRLVPPEPATRGPLHRSSLPLSRLPLVPSFVLATEPRETSPNCAPTLLLSTTVLPIEESLVLTLP
ncbi:hypothetical protein PFISCL1PPCAC_2791, partial [Pristionchus fissidentatus]